MPIDLSKSPNLRPTNEYVLWSSAVWGKAIPYWAGHSRFDTLRGLRGLELGAADGGLSMLLSDLGADTTCSDLEGSLDRAKKFHKTTIPDKKITYAAIDATKTWDQKYDLVVCKSVLASIGLAIGQDGIKTAISKIYENLNPGGEFWFIENLEGNVLHQKARGMSRAYAKPDRYLPLDSIDHYFREFDELSTKPFGVVAPFLPKVAVLQNAVAKLDQMFFEKILPAKNFFVIVGVGRKSAD